MGSLHLFEEMFPAIPLTVSLTAGPCRSVTVEILVAIAHSTTSKSIKNRV
jgi:hypothetical protein